MISVPAAFVTTNNSIGAGAIIYMISVFFHVHHRYLDIININNNSITISHFI